MVGAGGPGPCRVEPFHSENESLNIELMAFQEGLQGIKDMVFR